MFHTLQEKESTQTEEERPKPKGQVPACGLAQLARPGDQL